MPLNCVIAGIVHYPPPPTANECNNNQLSSPERILCIRPISSAFNRLEDLRGVQKYCITFAVALSSVFQRNISNG